MELPDLKKLNKLITLCRKRGIKVIKIDNIELTLSEDAPAPIKANKKGKYEELPGEKTMTDGWETLTPDQQMFYSVNPMPFEDSEGGNT